MDKPAARKLDRLSLSFRAFPGTRGCVALFHGMLASHHYFSDALGPRLQPWRLLLPDLLGFGASAKPPVEFTLDDHLSCLADLLEAEGSPAPLVLGGHSLGCLLATALAARLPEGRVAGMVFFNWAIRLTPVTTRCSVLEWKTTLRINLSLRSGSATRNPAGSTWPGCGGPRGSGARRAITRRLGCPGVASASARPAVARPR